MDDLFKYQEKNDGAIDHDWWCASTHENGQKCDCGFVEAVDSTKHLRAEVARLTAGIARIVDDYHPDGDDTAALALSEMREALMALLTKDGE